MTRAKLAFVAGNTSLAYKMLEEIGEAKDAAPLQPEKPLLELCGLLRGSEVVAEDGDGGFGYPAEIDVKDGHVFHGTATARNIALWWGFMDIALRMESVEVAPESAPGERAACAAVLVCVELETPQESFATANLVKKLLVGKYGDMSFEEARLMGALRKNGFLACPVCGDDGSISSHVEAEDGAEGAYVATEKCMQCGAKYGIRLVPESVAVDDE